MCDWRGGPSTAPSCIAHLGTAFGGYYVLQSNARPIRQAITGFAVGGIAVLLWRFVVQLYDQAGDQSLQQANERESQ
jgi:hypothetical protein